ncbi:hypothetical protein [Kitasatospora sp. NBC_01302]|uniref:hypothetical protein n=1 Tax=Kitasatospora sp. NBC_01302 TaxID=2903575 RepID=UPI002E14ED2E|nr:hypothetical protein OG294_38560 [Kitasatospora sp. NBC_01302]
MEASLSALAPQLQQARPGPLVPVLPALRALLPQRGLRPGTAVSVGGDTALLLTLASAATAAGTWCGAIGLGGLGLVAAAELGVRLDRFVLVESPGERWPEVVAAMADAFGILLVRPVGPVGGAVAARLGAVARRTGCVLLVAGPWPGAQVCLEVVDRSWTGVGRGRGRLRARRIQVTAAGRGAAARSRTVALWLPDENGTISPVEPLVTGTGPVADGTPVTAGSPVASSPVATGARAPLAVV